MYAYPLARRYPFHPISPVYGVTSNMLGQPVPGNAQADHALVSVQPVMQRLELPTPVTSREQASQTELPPLRVYVATFTEPVLPLSPMPTVRMFQTLYNSFFTHDNENTALEMFHFLNTQQHQLTLREYAQHQVPPSSTADFDDIYQSARILIYAWFASGCNPADPSYAPMWEAVNNLNVFCLAPENAFANWLAVFTKPTPQPYLQALLPYLPKFFDYHVNEQVLGEHAHIEQAPYPGANMRNCFDVGRFDCKTLLAKSIQDQAHFQAVATHLRDIATFTHISSSELVPWLQHLKEQGPEDDFIQISQEDVAS